MLLTIHWFSNTRNEYIYSNAEFFSLAGNKKHKYAYKIHTSVENRDARLQNSTRWKFESRGKKYMAAIFQNGHQIH